MSIRSCVRRRTFTGCCETATTTDQKGRPTMEKLLACLVLLASCGGDCGGCTDDSAPAGFESEAEAESESDGKGKVEGKTKAEAEVEPKEVSDGGEGEDCVFLSKTGLNEMEEAPTRPYVSLALDTPSIVEMSENGAVLKFEVSASMCGDLNLYRVSLFLSYPEADWPQGLEQPHLYDASTGDYLGTGPPAPFLPERDRTISGHWSMELHDYRNVPISAGTSRSFEVRMDTTGSVAGADLNIGVNYLYWNTGDRYARPVWYLGPSDLDAWRSITVEE